MTVAWGRSKETVAVIDFETTGLGPEWGARATEIAVVLVRDGEIVGRYASLMNAGVPIPPFIERLTGISTAMVAAARPASLVMREAAAYVGGFPLVAHNAAFDRKFWESELSRCRIRQRTAFACSMLVARRVYPEAPNHRLGTLVEYIGAPVEGRFHRAMADATAAARLLLRMGEDLRIRFGLEEVPHELLRVVQKAPRARLSQVIEAFRSNRDR